MTFLALLLAGVSEVISLYFMGIYANAPKLKSKLLALCAMTITFSISLYLLRFSMTEFAMSVAYAIWTGLGCVGAVFLSLFQGEKMNAKKLFFLMLIVVSVLGLKLEL